ncbi:PepSY-associated TM helix domain-containing protein [Sediminibacterium soli]|uniref:PepSY-associated TM helix domain-containing protein n=1 Tax=Sediminibacterium soli TaxID=2698829 RepID=UPI00137B5A26|nr:PepSY-associated TM helix domain-containing protein [Sediminibacterium soli]NCI46920.1 PepSY domain-containing protein [Sediminibacterium soli]
MRRSVLFRLHSLTGLLSGLFILLMSVSGSLLVFRDEIDSWQYPTVTEIPGKTLYTIDQAYTSLRQQYPRAQVNSVSLAAGSQEPFIFTVNDSAYFSGERSLQVFLHPQTGQQLRIRGGSRDISGNFMSWLGSFHNSFHLKKTGEWLLGFFALVFCTGLITGMALYRKQLPAVLGFRKQVFKRKKLHQLIGVYALLFNLVMGISGFWMQRYVFKKSFYQSFPAYQARVKTSGALFFSLDSALGRVKQQYRDFTPYVIYFAKSKKSNTAIYGSRARNSFIHSRKFADAVFLDSTGRIAKTAFVNEIDADDRYDIVNSQVHFGRYGGWPMKWLYVLLGISSGILSITGAALWWKRKRSQT